MPAIDEEDVAHDGSITSYTVNQDGVALRLTCAGMSCMALTGRQLPQAKLQCHHFPSTAS
jgi:hypothetical protein